MLLSVRDYEPSGGRRAQEEGNITAALGRMEGPNATGVVAQPILVMGQSLEPAAVPNCSSRWLVLWGCLPGCPWLRQREERCICLYVVHQARVLWQTLEAMDSPKSRAFETELTPGYASCFKPTSLQEALFSEATGSRWFIVYAW